MSAKMIIGAAVFVLGASQAVPAITGSGDSRPVAMAKHLAAARYGWTGHQWDCLRTLWQGESGFSRHADTRATHLDAPDSPVFAYGIAQARPATKMPRAALPASLGGSSNARVQEEWGLHYVKRTYGTPCAALAFKRASGNKGY